MLQRVMLILALSMIAITAIAHEREGKKDDGSRVASCSGQCKLTEIIDKQVTCQDDDDEVSFQGKIHSVEKKFRSPIVSHIEGKLWLSSVGSISILAPIDCGCEVSIDKQLTCQDDDGMSFKGVVNGLKRDYSHQGSSKIVEVTLIMPVKTPAYLRTISVSK